MNLRIKKTTNEDGTVTETLQYRTKYMPEWRDVPVVESEDDKLWSVCARGE